MQIGKIPFILFIFPFKDNSPTNTVSSIFCLYIFFIEHKIPTAIAKSKLAPSFFTSAGDKFIMYFLLSSSILQFLIAVLILSFDSFIVVSASPTTSLLLF